LEQGLTGSMRKLRNKRRHKIGN